MARKEGFWKLMKAPGENVMPWEEQFDRFPVSQKLPVDPLVLRALDAAEAQAQKENYFGASTCRLCHRSNGGEEFTLDNWTWPSGFRHYLTSHNVHPSTDFVKFITSLV